MLTREGERLKEHNPLGMLCVQLVLAIDVGQCFVIRIEHKGLELRLKVMTLMFQGSNNGMEFLVISGVVEP